MPRERLDPFEAWFDPLRRRHLSHLSFGEIRRALASLSYLYVERRESLATGAALEGEGKRAAFALFYGPIHFLIVRQIVRGLELHRPAPRRILDFGCGTGVAGSAWALECRPSPRVEGVDRSGWAVGEARWTYDRFGLMGNARRGLIESSATAKPGDAVLAAYTVNELREGQRHRLLSRLLRSARAGASLLIVEPIARRGFSWWQEWSDTFHSIGGEEDEWRLAAHLPDTLQLLSKASGMDHREIKAKSLWLDRR